jgi:outer membrane protein assembly factor BamB
MTEPRPPAWLAPVLRLTALIAGLLGFLLAGLVLVTALNLSAADPMGSATLKSFKERVARDGADEALYLDIRRFDLLARGAYFASQEHMVAGTALFIGAWALALVCLQLAYVAGRQQPAAPRRPSAGGTALLERRFRLGLAIGGTVLALACAASLLLVPREAWEGGSPPPATPVAGDPAEAGRAALDQWAGFRGPRAGVAIDPADAAGTAALPAAWVAGGIARLWESPLPESGLGSPVVWDDAVFVNAGSADRQLVIRLDAATGAVRWTTDLMALLPPSAGLPEISPDSSLATPSMALDAVREFVLFPTGRLACLDRDGKLVWSKELGLPDNSYGLSSSLAVWRDSLILQYDQTDKSTLVAFDCASGRLRWETVRESEAAWSSPVVVPGAAVGGGDDRIVVAGNPNLAAFRPADGSLAWQFAILGGEVASSPAWYGRTVFVANQYALAAAVDLDAAETGPPATAWEQFDDLPDISSPLAWDKGLAFCTSRGVVSCLEPASGQVRWRRELKEGVNASPVLLGTRLLVATTAGKLYALDSATGQTAWSLPLGGPVKASPAWHAGRLFIRTTGSLLALGTP